MLRCTRSSLALAGLLLAGSVTASAQSNGRGTAPDPLDRAVKAWAKVKTARASFEQTITNPLTERTLTASGEFQQERPGKLSVTFRSPSTDRIVSDGKHVWLYLPSSAPGQVIKMPVAAASSGTVDLTAQFLTSPRSRFTVSRVGSLPVGGRRAHGYRLVPKRAAGALFTEATVWIDDTDAMVRQFDVTELTGVQRTVRLTSLATNVRVDAAAFVFTPPAGSRVVLR